MPAVYKQAAASETPDRSITIVARMGAFAILAALATAYGLSSARAQIRLRTVAWGLGLQVLLALLVLQTPFGQVFAALGKGFNEFVRLAEEGSGFVFGDLGRSANGVIIAFQILPLIILFSALSAIFYHMGIMQRIVGALALVMQRGMRASGAEALTIAANLFIGQAEAPLAIRPYLDKLTRSELMTVMTGGMATVSGAMLLAYVQVGGARPEHLFTAVMMTAPACLMMAKIIEPETGRPETLGQVPKQSAGTDRNVIDAASRGASEGLSIALQVGAMLVTFVGLIGIVNGILHAIRGSLGRPWLPGNLQSILGPLFAPVAWLLGVAWADAATVGNLLGTRMVLNEFISYAELAGLKDALRPHSYLVASYALCGFANIGSVGILIGALGALLPGRRAELAALGLRAMVAATLSNFMTAAIAGLIAFTPLLEF